MAEHVIQKHSDKLSNLPPEIVQLLFTEGVISRETYYELEKSSETEPPTT